MEMEPSRQPRCGRTEAYKHIRRQNQVDLALRELGRIERTLFMLDGLESLELRRGCHAGLSKSEQRHFLAQVICTFKQGRQTRPDFRRSAEVPAVRASGLNLVIAAIVFGNSTHIADGDVWASHASGHRLFVRTEMGDGGAASAAVLRRSSFRCPSSYGSASWSRANWRRRFR